LFNIDNATLKREHDDAIEMLKHLDEENKRLFVTTDGGSGSRRTDDEEGGLDEVGESLAVTLPEEGMLHATHLSISLHE
jgi:hypothetical protein